MPRTYQPLGDRVLIKPLSTEEVTKSGLVLPETAKEKPQEGEVVAVGPGRLTEEGKRLPMDLKTGERVLYAKYAGSELKEDSMEFLLLSERDILAKIVGK
ncbi:MAG: co-chaperone GroES [Dehalococcoidia bacterium]|nr:co-chaperone GroES [Dehalococcoidia bacterium]